MRIASVGTAFSAHRYRQAVITGALKEKIGDSWRCEPPRLQLGRGLPTLDVFPGQGLELSSVATGSPVSWAGILPEAELPGKYN
jgi:hypothetical protein